MIPTPLEIAKAALTTISFQGLNPSSEMAKKALGRIKEIEEIEAKK